jgi:hypothetical protein
MWVQSLVCIRRQFVSSDFVDGLITFYFFKVKAFVKKNNYEHFIIA